MLLTVPRKYEITFCRNNFSIKFLFNLMNSDRIRKKNKTIKIIHRIIIVILLFVGTEK